MITTLLFDLDDTLLDNDLSRFLPAYFERLAAHFASHTAPPQLINAVITGTRAMLADPDPANPLLAVFQQHFGPGVGWSPAEIQTRFDDFYRQSYPALQTVTAPRPAARPILEWAIAAGYQIVIATAPIFPLAAIRERLRWAGLDDLPFTLITSVEQFHFAKPHPQYLAEILGYLGRRPDEACLIGNDWADDMVPAAKLGLPHYWIAPADSSLHGAARPLGVGDLDSFWAWARAALPTLKVPPPPPSALPHLLAGHLAAVVGRLADLTPTAWVTRPAADEWSPTEIVCHLRDVDREVNLPRLRAVLETDNPFIAGADTDPWARERDYQSQSGPRALQDFIAARTELYRELARHPISIWEHPARHSLLGPSTLADLVNVILDHDRIHLEQLRVIAREQEAIK